MNIIKKIGLTALATSLVAGSAYAGEASVSGSVGYTWKTRSGNGGDPDEDHGKGIGTDNSLAFNYSGELDNGWSVAGYTTLQDSFGLTSSAVTLTMGDMGSLMTGSGTGGNSAGFDEETPRAYEQVDDGASSSSSMNLVGSWNDNGGIHYTAPSVEAMGATLAIVLGYVPKAEDAYVTGGSTSGVSTMGSGYDAGVTISHDSGLKVGIYGATRGREGTAAANLNDAFEGTWYATYNMGPVSIGYQQSYVDTGLVPAQTATTTAKAVGTTGSGYFEADQMAIAFNVNDDLSISYAKLEDTYDAQAGAAAGTTTGGGAVSDVTMDMKSIQAAYSMGSMSIKAYRTETDNVGYATNGGSLTVNEIALGLSF